MTAFGATVARKGRHMLSHKGDDLHIYVLGPLRVSLGGRDITPRQGRLRGLLGMLVLAGPDGVSQERLLQAGWAADRDSKDSAAALHIAVSRLRAWSTAAGQGRLAVLRQPAGYRLDAVGCVVDAQRFAALATAADRDGCPASERLRLLEEACALWRGDCLAGLPEPVRDAAGVQAWQKRRTASVLALAETARHAGWADRGLAHLEELAAAHQFDERLHAELIRLLAADGRPAEALATFERIRELLAAELGIDPSPELREAHLSVLRHGGRGADPAGGTSPASDGSGSSPARPNQLPMGTGDFVGRADLVAEVAELLTQAVEQDQEPAVRPAMPVVALAGSPGVGKTTLAVEVAHRLHRQFPDGRLFIELHGVRQQPVEPADALGRLLRALGVSSDAIPADADERAALFRSRTADQQLLVVLDNAANAAQVRPLLPGGTRCAVLLTSRRALATIPGVRLLNLGVLDSAEAVALLGRVCGESRVTDEAAEALRIVEYCGRLPLAIRIAGARLASRPQWRLDRLSRLLADERHRLDELASDDLEVRASIGLSVAALEAPQRRLFGLLGQLEAPDFPAWVAAAVLDVPPGEGDSLLEELVEVRLVEAFGEDATGGLRYRMHDLVRLVARELAGTPGELAQRRPAVARAAEGWLLRASRARLNFPGPPLPDGVHPAVKAEQDAARPGDQGLEAVADARAWFEAERAALSAMVSQAAECHLAELAWRLSATAVAFFDLCGYWDDWQRTNQAALRASRAAGDGLGVATTLWGLAEFQIARDRYDEALATLTDAARYFAEHGDRSTQATLLARIGFVHRVQGRVQDSRKMQERALRLLVGPGSDVARSYVLRNLGALHRDIGVRDDARRYLTQALQAAERSGDRYGQAVTLEVLGKSHQYWNEPAIARGYLAEAVERYESIGDRIGALHAQVAFGEVMVTLGEPVAARQTLHECLVELGARDDQFGEASALLALGWAELNSGNLPAARQRLESSLAYWRRSGVLPLQARALERLARVHQALGDGDEARRHWRAALDIYRRLNAPEASRIAELLATRTDGNQPSLVPAQRADADGRSTIDQWPAAPQSRPTPTDTSSGTDNG